MESTLNNENFLTLEGSAVLGDRALESEPMQFDCKEKMTYTEQAAKRKHCQRLTRYAHNNNSLSVLLQFHVVLFASVTTLS